MCAYRVSGDEIGGLEGVEGASSHLPGSKGKARCFASLTSEVQAMSFDFGNYYLSPLFYHNLDIAPED